jgi:diguanylate cyclase (GGDEF)-like protein/PAS domain S-box-containing protein
MKPAVRISLGVVAVTVSLLLIADSVFEIFPYPDAPVLEARKDLSESLAIQYSSLVTAERLQDMKPAMEAVVAQMPDVLSMNLRKSNGESVAATSAHASLWTKNSSNRSTPTQVLIPIFQDDTQWAVLEVKFDELPSAGLLGLLSNPLYKLVAVMAAAGFLVYLIYLSRMLRYLDPSTVVPSRVRAALDQLVEGVFILDSDQCIVLANSAFAKKVGATPESLIGVDPSRLPWISADAERPSSALPWTVAIRDGVRITDERLELQSPSLGLRVFTTNVSPIVDGGGKRRGVLASFDDVSELEKMNTGLQNTLRELEKAHAEVHSKNEELFRLATIDPLTECLNRRAFFEKLESEFDLSKRGGLKLSVVMADIDHFKKVNDDYGHAVGDAVIKDMAHVLRQASRVNDCVGRYGGEEFCMVLVGADEAAAIQVSERARSAFESRLQLADSSTGGNRITASFGVSTLEFGAVDVADFLNQADQALYKSKHDGRNRVTSWIELDAHQHEAV